MIAGLTSLSDEDLVSGLVEWSENESPESFDPSFIHAMQANGDELTPKQRSALERIANGFKVDESYFS